MDNFSVEYDVCSTTTDDDVFPRAGRFERQNSKNESEANLSMSKWMSLFAFSQGGAPSVQPKPLKRSGSSFTLNKKSIEDVRRQVLERYIKCEQNNNNASEIKVDKRDLKRVMEDDEYVERFLIYALNIGTSSKGLIDRTVRTIEDTFKFRYEYKVNDLEFTDFSQEFLDVSLYGWNEAVNSQFRGVNMTYMVYYRAAMYKRVKWYKEGLAMVACILEHFERKSNGHGPVKFLLDCSNFNLSNMDISFGMELVHCCFKYFPGLVESFDLIDCHPLARAAANICMRVMTKNFLNLDRIRFLSQQELLVELGSHNVSLAFGGTASNVTWTNQIKSKHSFIDSVDVPSNTVDENGEAEK